MYKKIKEQIKAQGLKRFISDKLSREKIKSALESFFTKENLRKLAKNFGTGPGFKKRLLAVAVYIPTVLIGFYLLVLHSNMYISETRFALRSSESNEIPAIAGMLFQTATSTTLDAYVIQEYITSLGMLQKVDSEVAFKEHYSRSDWDVVSRLKKDPSNEELLDYWRKVVAVNFNPDKGIIVVETRAYTPEMARLINQAIVQESEALVNRINERSHQDSLHLTQKEVRISEKRLLNAQVALQKFRDDKSILDPLSTAKGLESVIAQLESEAASTQAELTAALEVMQPNSPRVISIQTKLSALHDQLVKERARLAGIDSQDGTLSSLVGDYAQLATEERFAEEQYIKSMAAYEMARLKAISQSRYIVPFMPPSLPQESLYPRPILYTLFVFLGLLVCLGIISLVIAAIKDHMGV